MARQIRKWNPGNAANIFVRVVLSEAGALLGGLSDEQWGETLRYFDHRCAYTGVPLVDGDVDQDHAIPMNRQHCGLHLYGNVVPAAKSVNNAKGNVHYREFVTDSGRLARIDRFLEQAEYAEKVAAFGDLRRYLDSQYDAIDALCRVSRRYLKGLLPDAPHAEEGGEAEPAFERRSVAGGDVLPIALDPSPAAAFKAAVMRTKRAWIVEHYADGKRVVKPWNAGNISASSNIIGNLRSKPPYRAAAWLASGLVRIDVTLHKPSGG